MENLLIMAVGACIFFIANAPFCSWRWWCLIVALVAYGIIVEKI
jgi:hypothetical protein